MPHIRPEQAQYLIGWVQEHWDQLKNRVNNPDTYGKRDSEDARYVLSSYRKAIKALEELQTSIESTEDNARDMDDMLGPFPW